MQQKIEQLKDLFKQRDEIDSQITEVINGDENQPVNTIKANTKKSPGKKWSRNFDKCIDCGTTEKKHSCGGRCQNCQRRFKMSGGPVSVPNFRCKACLHTFQSDKNYLDLKCGKCGSARITKV